MSAITRVYESWDEARRVVAALEHAGVPGADIGLIGRHTGGEDYDAIERESATAAGLGALVGGGGGLLAGLAPGLGPVVAGGVIATALFGALAGATAGGVIGALAAAGVPEDEAARHQEALRQGGALVTVRDPGAKRPGIAAIMDEATPTR